MQNHSKVTSSRSNTRRISLLPTPPAKVQTKVRADASKASDLLQAVDKSQAVIEFTLDGEVVSANNNFLRVLGYTEPEIVGRHHSMFVDATYAQTQEYRSFWATLRKGEYVSGEFHRLAKDGSTVWIQGSYNPVLDEAGRPVRVVKFATEVTQSKLQEADYKGRLTAIDRAQAVIEFDLDGTILNANDNFLSTLGYTLPEIKGRHHGMFVDGSYRQSQDYQEFWAKLNRGEFLSDIFKRFGKGQREVWIQGTYNPIFNPNGKVCKVVKFATDVTEQVRAREQQAAAGERDRLAAIEVQTQVDQLLEVVAAAANGDLTHAIPKQGEGVVGQMAAGLDRLLSDLRDSVSSIGQTAMGVASSSEELSAISQQLTNSSQSTLR